MTAERFPKRFYFGDITLKKISSKCDDAIITEIFNLYRNNKKHLFYWHHGLKQLLFRNTSDMVYRIKKCRLICYAIFNLDKMVGCIEFTKVGKDFKNIKYRNLSFWVDKNNVRKGIMYNCLKALENHFALQDINVLNADVNTENMPSINLLKKLGYKNQSASFLLSDDGELLCNTYSFQKSLIKGKSA